MRKFNFMLILATPVYKSSMSTIASCHKDVDLQAS